MNTILTIKEFAALKGFTQIAPIVRVNQNGYPFITFIDADNKAENVYFSKAASEKVAAGLAVDKDLLSKHQVREVLNADGELRWKLISNSDRVNLTDLL